MITTMLTLLVVGFFILLYYGFRKIDRKLEALVRLNNKKINEERRGK